MILGRPDSLVTPLEGGFMKQKKVFKILPFLLLSLGQPSLAQVLITDDPASANTPQIQLPVLPPPSPTSSGSNNNSNNSTGSSNSGPVRSSGNTMSSVANSAFPGLTCPLTENRPYQDLVKAINNLARAVVVTNECQDNTDIKKLQDTLNRMVQSGTYLVGLWQNPDTIMASNNNPNLGQFQSSLQDVLVGMNQVTAILQSNSFFNSKCGQNLTTAGGLVLAVSDLVSALAPFALIGAAMNPSLKVALPYILGITGVGSVSKIIKTMHEQNTLDMNKPEHRQAVLDNVCEYSKIAIRVRFLQLAQSGALDQLGQELDKLQTQASGQLQLQFGARPFQISKIHDTYRSRLQELKKNFVRYAQEHKSFQEQLKDTDDRLYCELTYHLLKDTEAAQYPRGFIQEYKRMLSMQVRPTVYQSTLVQSFERQSSSILGQSQFIDSAQCQREAKNLHQVLAKMVDNAEVTVKALEASLEQGLLADPEYRRFSALESSMKKEMEFLRKIKNLLAQMQLDNSLIDKLELDSRMNDVKSALFGTPKGIVVLRGKSPAMAWLDFAWAHHERARNDFLAEFRLLVRDAYLVTQSGRGDFVRRDAQGNPIRDRWGQPIRYSPAEQVKIIMNDIKSSEDLSPITPKIAPVGSDNHRVLCRRLENIWMSWAAAVDHLKASQFFCGFIAQFFDRNTEKSIINRCEGQYRLDGSVIRHSEIEQRLSELQKSRHVQFARRVRKKMTELACPMPAVDVLK